jgi:hypothetical protein
MPTFLQPVCLPKRCFLFEVLLWVAFGRLPLATYTYDGKEVRETDEVGNYEVDSTGNMLSDDETKRAGIPDDPTWVAIMSDRSTLDVSKFDEWLASCDLDDDLRRKWEGEREEARAYKEACDAWDPHYKLAIEYPASRIFVALKGGLLRAQGRLLPAIDRDAALSALEAKGDRGIYGIAATDIPPSFWSLQGINFEASAAHNGTHHYCHISCRTDDVLSVFPGERQEVSGIEQIGDSFVLSEKREARRSSLHRGRPSYPWDAFHIEVAGLLRRNELPQKKEAAIEHFQNWFRREHGIGASRSVVGDKLKPYYDRFMRTTGQKTR